MTTSFEEYRNELLLLKELMLLGIVLFGRLFANKVDSDEYLVPEAGTKEPVFAIGYAEPWN